jgi:hypothetical protein
MVLRLTCGYPPPPQKRGAVYLEEFIIDTKE